MLKIKVILLGIIISTNIYGQDNDTSTDTLKHKQRKNEVGLNVTPVLIYLMQADAIYPRFAITYKRVSKKGAFRFRVNYIDDYTPYEGNGDLDNSTLIYETDSTELMLEKYSSADNWRINLGYEWRRNPQKRMKWFYGAELILGVNTTNANNNINLYDKDSMNLNTAYIPLNIESYSLRANVYRIGILPFIGLQYPISKKFLIAAHSEFGLAYYFGNKIVEGNNYKLIKESYQSWEVEEYSGNLKDISIISDISIFYRF